MQSAFQQPVLQDMSLDFICSGLIDASTMLKLKTPAHIIDKFVEHKLNGCDNGSSLLKVIKNIDNPQLVSKELDELLADILGMKDVFEKKRGCTGFWCFTTD